MSKRKSKPKPTLLDTVIRPSDPSYVEMRAHIEFLLTQLSVLESAQDHEGITSIAQRYGIDVFDDTVMARSRKLDRSSSTSGVSGVSATTVIMDEAPKLLPDNSPIQPVLDVNFVSKGDAAFEVTESKVCKRKTKVILPFLKGLTLNAQFQAAKNIVPEAVKHLDSSHWEDITEDHPESQPDAQYSLFPIEVNK